jgi:hypothetical protein
VLPWHQDRWAHLDRDPLLTVYTALDPATAATGCIHLIPKSHELGCLNPSHHSGFLTEAMAEAGSGLARGARRQQITPIERGPAVHRAERKLYRVGPNCGPTLALTGIFSQIVGSSLAIWANPVRFLLRP